MTGPTLMREAVARTLRDHWLTGTNCAHEGEGTNYASCSCSLWRGPLREGPGALRLAVGDWIAHVLEHAALLATPGRGDEGLREALLSISCFAKMRAEDDSKTFARVNRGALRTIAEKARTALSNSGEGE